MWTIRHLFRLFEDLCLFSWNIHCGCFQTLSAHSPFIYLPFAWMQVLSHVADTLPFHPSNDLFLDGVGAAFLFFQLIYVHLSMHRCTEFHVNAYKYSFIQIFYVSLEHLCVSTSLLSRFIHSRAPFPAVVEHVPTAGYMSFHSSCMCSYTAHTPSVFRWQSIFVVHSTAIP